MNTITKEIQKIRNVRKRIAADHGNDPHKLVAYYQKRASAKQDREVNRPAKEKR